MLFKRVRLSKNDSVSWFLHSLEVLKKDQILTQMGTTDCFAQREMIKSFSIYFSYE